MASVGHSCTPQLGSWPLASDEPNPGVHPNGGDDTRVQYPTHNTSRPQPQCQRSTWCDVTRVSVRSSIIEHMFVSDLEWVRPVAAASEKVRVQVAAESVPAGWPSPAQDYFDGDVDLNEHLIRNRPATFVVRVCGDSMTGAGISDGDELIVDRALDPGDGDVVIAIVEDEMTVKRLHLTPAGPELHPANPNYPVLRPHELSVWGVVTTCLHHLRR